MLSECWSRRELLHTLLCVSKEAAQAVNEIASLQLSCQSSLDIKLSSHHRKRLKLCQCTGCFHSMATSTFQISIHLTKGYPLAGPARPA